MAKAIKLPQRWPSPPPDGQPCDAHTGVDTDWTGKPVVKKCGEYATETLVSLRLPWDMWVCEEHAIAFSDNADAIRNPTKHPYYCQCGGRCKRSPNDGYLRCEDCHLTQP